jgi:hypothetical protein
LVNSEYSIWAVDNVVYGPVDLPLLTTWVEEERITPGTWVYVHAEEKWRLASQLPELQSAFPPVTEDGTAILPKSFEEPESVEFRPGEMRRIKIFANMSDDQILQFGRFLELNHFRRFAEIVRQGNPGDAMYFILDGEVRVRLMIGDRETQIATLGRGDFFGEISLFDHGPRSADVVANDDVTLLKLSAASFQKLAESSPDLATPFLMAMGRTLTSRIRADNKRFGDTIAMNRGVAQVSF